jgi:sugar/nucleoside kinase (ribokinase family)
VTPLDVLAIGNALVDVLAHVDDDDLAARGFEKASYSLLDEADAERLYALMPPSVEISGGGAANTAAGVDSMGGEAGYIGKVKRDQLGDVFTHDIRAIGVEFTTPPATDGPPTGRCLALITPDAERTMRTYLGAAEELTAADLDEDQIAHAQVTYLEGYLWLPDGPRDALHRAITVAHDAGRLVALTLSDPFCVETRRKDFLALLDDGQVDVVFANEDEIKTLFEVDDFDDAARQIAPPCQLAAITRGAQGSVVVTPDRAFTVAAAPVERVVDTTGAGDLYAAGFLYGLTHGADPAACARLGGIAAAEIISHVGSRPEVSLAELASSILA